MISPTLFLGYPVTPSLEEQLANANPALTSLFTSGGEYLEDLQMETCRYFGKRCPSLPNLQDLENLEANIQSLLRRLVPDIVNEKPTYLVILNAFECS